MKRSRRHKKIDFVQRHIDTGVDGTRAAHWRDDDTVELSFSSEAAVKDYPWAPPIRLLHEGRSMIRGGLHSALFNHDPGRVIGAVSEVRIDEDERKGRAVLTFDKDEASQIVRDKMRSGSIRGISAGFEIQKAVRLRKDDKHTTASGREFGGQGEMILATRWKVHEISATPIPADGSVGPGRMFDNLEDEMTLSALVRQALIAAGAEEGADFEGLVAFARNNAARCLPGLDDFVVQSLGDEALGEWLNRNETKVGRAAAPAQAAGWTPETVTASSAPPVAPAPVTAAPAAPAIDPAEVVAGERQRVSALRDVARLSRIDDAVLRRWEDEGVTVDRAREEALNLLGEAEPAIGSGTPARVEAEPQAQNTTRFRDAYAAHMLRRHATNHIMPDDLPAEGADDGMAYYSPVGFLRQSFRMHGGDESTQRMDDPAFLEHMFHADRGRRSFAASHAMSDFSYALENIMTKALRKGFEETPTTFGAWTVSGTLPDFREGSRVNLGSMANFKEIPENHPIGEETFGDVSEKIQVKVFGSGMSYSWQLFIDDDLNILARRPALLAAAAARTRNQRAYDQLVHQTKTMEEDAKTLFATDHTSGSNTNNAAAVALTTDNLGAARLAMRMQKPMFRSDDDRTHLAALNIVPRYLIVPAALETEARKFLFGDYEPATLANARLPQSLELVVEPYLDLLGAPDDANWYLVADPSQYDTIEVATLAGVQGMQLRNWEGNDSLGFHYRAFYTAGYQTLQHRTFYRSGTYT